MKWNKPAWPEKDERRERYKIVILPELLKTPSGVEQYRSLCLTRVIQKPVILTWGGKPVYWCGWVDESWADE